MKKSDINRLKKVVLHLQQVEKDLDKVCYSLWNQDAEYIRFLDGQKKLTRVMVYEMYAFIEQERRYIEDKISVFEEL